jgi:tetratricopeptide (TPR) repeat protein
MAVVITYFSRSFAIPSKLQSAEKMLNEGNHQGAIEILKKVLEIEKGHPRARFLLARSYYSASQYVLAISELKNLLVGTGWKSYFKEPEIRYFLAEIYHQTEQWGKEIQEYKIIQAINPNDPYVNRKLGLVYFEQKQYEDAHKTLKRLVDVNNNEVEILYPYAVAAYETDNLNIAQQIFERVLKIDPNSLTSQYYLGLVFKKDKKWPKAIEHFEKAIEEIAVRELAWNNIGSVYIEMDDFKKAAKALKNIPLTGDKESLEAAYNLAFCYEKLGQFAEAIKIWEELSSSFNNYRNARDKVDEYLEISQSEELNWFFSLNREQTKTMLVNLLSRMGLNTVKAEAINDRFYKLISFRNKSQLDSPVLIEVFKSTNEFNEMSINDFKKDMDTEKALEGIIVTTSGVAQKVFNYVEGKQISVIDGFKFIKILKEIKSKIQEQNQNNGQDAAQ